MGLQPGLQQDLLPEIYYTIHHRQTINTSNTLFIFAVFAGMPKAFLLPENKPSSNVVNVAAVKQSWKEKQHLISLVCL